MNAERERESRTTIYTYILIYLYTGKGYPFKGAFHCRKVLILYERCLQYVTGYRTDRRGREIYRKYNKNTIFLKNAVVARWKHLACLHSGATPIDKTSLQYSKKTETIIMKKHSCDSCRNNRSVFFVLPFFLSLALLRLRNPKQDPPLRGSFWCCSLYGFWKAANKSD